MSLHSWEVQKAIFTALTGNVTGIGAANVSVYDDVPENTSYPYVVIVEETATNNGTKMIPPPIPKKDEIIRICNNLESP